MKVLTEQHYKDFWSAIDDDTYDGPGSPLGSGRTEAEAIADLQEQTIVKNCKCKNNDDYCSYCEPNRPADFYDGNRINAHSAGVDQGKI